MISESCSFINGMTQNGWNLIILWLSILQFYLKARTCDYRYVNLEKKNLIDETCAEFAEFSERFELDTEYDKKELYEDFKQNMKTMIEA